MRFLLKLGYLVWTAFKQSVETIINVRVSGFDRYFWSWSKDSGSLDQSRDTHPSPVTDVRTDPQSSAASRFEPWSALVTVFILN